jgi:copper resistance protein D
LLVDLVSVAIRALAFIALLQAGGLALYLVTYGKQLVTSTPSVTRDLRIAAWVAAIALIAYQLLGAARLTGEFSGILDWSMQAIALDSNDAIANGLRLLVALILASVALSSGNQYRVVLFGATVVIIVSFSLTGHTVTTEHRWLLAPLLMLHLSVVVFWFGCLLPLARLNHLESRPIALAVIGQFSQLASWLVPGLALVGLIIAWKLLPDVTALVRPYGLLLLLKAFGFSLVLGLAAYNKWRLVPAMAAGSDAAWRRFHRSVKIEYCLICAVLTATAVMTGMFSPEG